MSKITKFQVLESQSPPKSGDQEKCPPKLLFSDLKFGQNHLFDPFQKYLPPHDIHGWKVMDISFLMGFSKKINIDPTNFGDSPGQIPKLILTLCHNLIFLESELKNFECQILFRRLTRV